MEVYMKFQFKKIAFCLAFTMVMLALAGCGAPAPVNETGTLEFTANGEEFIREGFIDKDGWELSFDHAYVSLTELTAYQTNPHYSTEQGWDITAVETVSFPGTFVADLAASDGDPVILGEVGGIPAGHYNAFSWTMNRALEGPAAGYVIVLQGLASKDGETIRFTLRFAEELLYRGGEYVGDVRKGIVTSAQPGQLEATFHFDHLFGDGGEGPDEEINRNALGFSPFAALAQDGVADVSSADLKTLNPVAYEQLRRIYLHLAHVGEGHCLARFR
jgi:hypothetical protein